MWGTPFAAAYTASKWGVRGLTKVAALELGRKGIRVNSVHPGGVKTPMTAAVGDDGESGWYDRLPVPRIGNADDIANAVLFLASDEAAYITGTELVIDGGTLAGDIACDAAPGSPVRLSCPLRGRPPAARRSSTRRARRMVGVDAGTVPPWGSATSRTMASPRPVPRWRCRGRRRGGRSARRPAPLVGAGIPGRRR